MNKRIKELAFEANKDLDGNVPIGFAEKFAELIVKECITLLPDDCQSKNGCHTSWSIKEHFGVEE